MVDAISRENVDDFCRTCLSEWKKVNCGVKYNIHEIVELTKWIEWCASLGVSKNDGQSNFVCKQCFDKLQCFQEFRAMTIRANRIIKNIFAMHSRRELQKALKTKNTNAAVCTTNESDDINVDWIKFNTDFELQKENIVRLSPLPLLVETEVFLNEQHEYKQENISESEAGNDLEEAIIEKTETLFPAEKYKTESEPEIDLQDQLLERMEMHCPLETLLSQEHSIDVKKGSNDLQPANGSMPKSTDLSIPDIIPKGKRKSNAKEKRAFELLQCPDCTKRCASQESLDAHMRTHNGLRKYQCEKCERSFNNITRFRLHMNESHSNEKKEIVCAYKDCGKVFNRESCYKRHFLNIHFHEAQNKERPAAQKYVCEECGRVCKGLQTLKNHRTTHLPEKRFRCEICGKLYASRGTYNEHLLRHRDIKKYECPHCGARKATAYELRLHINYHTKEKTWSCTECPQTFNSYSARRRHVNAVHKGIRRFVCRFCQQAFSKKETLKDHEMRHTGERPHACNVCGKGFIKIVAMRAHMKTHNDNKKLTNSDEAK